MTEKYAGTQITVLQRPDFTVTQEADNVFHLQS